MKKQWKKAVPIVLGTSFLGSALVNAAELTDQYYTSTISSITSGTHTVNNGNVTLDATGYTGTFANQRAIINTLNGAVNINIAQGNTLTIKGFNNQASQQRSALYAYKNGSLSGTMTFTGGNIVVSNEHNNSSSDIYGLFAGSGGKFDFQSDGDNKVNLTVLMPQAGLINTHRWGIGLYNGELTFDGGNFIINVDGDPGPNSIDRRVGIVLAAGSDVDVKADQILIDTNELALMFAGMAGSGNAVAFDVNNTAKFEADSIILRGSQGILSALDYDYYGVRNSAEFTGETLIEAIIRGDENNVFGQFDGGRAIDVMATDLTFNGNTTIIGENLTTQGTDNINNYWLKTVSLTDSSSLVANGDFSITSDGGYYNTGLYVWDAQAEFNGKTNITLNNGVNTARAIYVYGTSAGTTKAEFNDDLTVSLAGSHTGYDVGIEAAAGGKVNVKKGLILNDNDSLYWALYSRGANTRIDVNSNANGVVQVVGDISATNSGAISMNLNTPNSYLTATSYTSTSGATSLGTVNLDISNEAIWNMTGSSKVTNLNLDQGVVNYLAPSNSGGFKTLTVHGDYNGGGTFIINTALGGDDSETDKLIVEGNTSGTSDLIVNNYNGTGAATVDGIEVVNVAGQSDGIFTLGNRVVAGAYEYNIQKTGNNWYLVNTLIPTDPEPNPDPEPTPTPTPDPDENEDDDVIRVIRPETGAYIANLAAANNLFISRLHDRLGETQYTDYLTGETKVTSMWLRQEGGHNRSRTQSGQAKTQQNRYVAQLGGDIAQWSSSELDRFHLGVMASYGHAQGNTTSKYTIHRTKNKVEGYALGLYGTWYANQADKTGLYVDSWVQYAWFDNTVQGDGIAKEEYDSKGWLASVETGYSFKISGDERSSYWLQPKAQLTWMGIHADKHYEANGTKVTGNGDNLLTRLGLRAYRQGYSDVDADTGRVFQPFVEVNWLHNSKNFGVTMNDVSEYQSGARNIGEVKVGVEGHLNKNLNMWGNIAQQVGGNGYSDTQAIIGIKYSF